MRAGGFSYADALAWLDSHINYERRSGRPRDLGNLARLLGALGDPQAAAPVVHVTGTNGKGSTSTMTAALLSSYGLKVGLYTSPDLERVNERISINAEPIPDEAFAHGCQLLARLEAFLSLDLTRFELLTALAFWHFADEAVDVVVLEVGLGGAYDATNLARGDVAVLTNVSLDHTDVLGPSEEHIAADKAQIIKEGAAAVVGPMAPGPLALVRRRAIEVKTRSLVVFGQDLVVEEDLTAVGGRYVRVRTPRALYEDVYLSLHGRHQAENAACALAATEELFGSELEPDIVRSVLSCIRIPGRCEVIMRDPLVIVDGAHNEAGARRITETLLEEFRPDAVHLVTGILADKDAEAFYSHLARLPIASAVVCEPPSPRAARAEALAAYLGGLLRGARVAAVKDPKAALELSLQSAQGGGMVLVTGSLYIVGLVRAALLEGRL